MEKLYVLAGKARSGKDTTSEILDEIYTSKGKKVIKLSYGYYPQYYGSLICEWDGKEETKPRTELQNIALESRKINPGFIVRRMEEDINILQKYADIIIITDSRMPEEVNMPKAKFKETITIKVERPNYESPLTKVQKTSLIETALDNYHAYDYTIQNEGSLDDLKNKINNIIEDN